MAMNTLKSKRCSILMERYLKNGDVGLRNSIYELSRTAIIKCLKTATRKPLTENELLSLSWDVFLICIDRYSPEEAFKYTLVNAAHTVINKVYADIKKKNNNEQNIGDAEYPEPNIVDTIALRDSLIALKDFRDGLPKGYRVIVDDCLASFGGDTRGKQSRVPLSKLPAHRYYEAKKVLTWAIEHILGRGDNGASKNTRKQLRKRDCETD